MATSQDQCPNCGGYDIEMTNAPVGCLILTILGFFFYIIPGLIALPFLISKRKKAEQDIIDGKAPLRCKLCKYEFYIDEVPSRPIKPNATLIALGRKRLDEEEERARQAAIYQSMQRRKK
ncbi:MAG: hypothetical protein QXX08_10310 [Candidatus Bathyarchaeia archaeon]